MSWPRCPSCSTEDVAWVDRANENLLVEFEVYRSYRCPCGWSAWTVERITLVDPPTLFLRKRFGVEERPAVPTVSTET